MRALATLLLVISTALLVTWGHGVSIYEAPVDARSAVKSEMSSSVGDGPIVAGDAAPDQTERPIPVTITGRLDFKTVRGGEEMSCTFTPARAPECSGNVVHGAATEILGD